MEKEEQAGTIHSRKDALDEQTKRYAIFFFYAIYISAHLSAPNLDLKSSNNKKFIKGFP